ncbi:hypothetical protein GCU60_09030 [Blastococcus saxobsidens]|uniref:Uncharacterized protein n=1 Tax=Blastococcus saxobsidens TaxID=138336 RepID=A0A6L9W3A0_9ACTN|nr:hypothetical protein [Blastococcus saxobsidens]NEK85904.1 hypothetical protein [Blastococcus saxobsidens]
MTSLAGDLLEPLDDGDTAPARAWLGEVVTSAGMPRDQLAALGGLGRWNADRADGGLSAAAADALRTAVRLTAGERTAGGLLALCLRADCEAAWEVSWEHGPVQAVIDTALAARPADGGAAEGEWALLALVGREMLVEAAAASGSLVVLAEHAAATATVAAEVAALCSDRAGDPLSEHTAEVADAEADYYRAVAIAARAVSGYPAAGDDVLADAVAVLARAEARFAADDVARGELRAHRASLEALRDAQAPALRVAAGSVVHLYPFGLRGVTPGAAVRAVRGTGARWTLAGMPVTGVERELPLNDVWKGNDPLGRQYAGAALVLPDVLLPDADLGEPHRLRVEVRLTELGNHCVRIVAPLSEAGPQALYAAQVRAAPEAADLRELGTPLVPADGLPGLEWGRLSDLAAAICADLCGQFAEHTREDSVAVSTRAGAYHVLTRVERAEALVPGRPPVPVEDPERLRALVGGALLGHPVRHGVSAIAEWAGYRPDAATAIDAPGMVEGLVLRTANTTALACPRAPSYMVDAVQEAAEFVATLDGLFAGWQVELADHYYRINREMERLQEEIARRPAEGAWDLPFLDGTQRDLEAAQHAMQLFVMAARLRLMFITAPSLVTSPVMRTTLDHLLAAAGFDRARADFVGTVEDVVGDRAWALIDSSVRRRQELAEDRRREQEATARARQADDEARGRRRMDILLAAVAAVGISGIFSLLQAGYALTGWRSALLAGFALLTAAATGAITHRLTATDRCAGGARCDPPC